MFVSATGATPKRLPMYSLVTGNSISLIGSTLTIIALPWFVLQTTGSASKAGLVGFSAAIPRILAGVFGGAIIDRIGAKHMSVVADILSGLAIVMIPLLYYFGSLAFWKLSALVFVGSLLNIPGTNARRAIVPELAQLADTRLERVNSAFESIQYLARLLGAPLAGLLIALFGASNVLWLDGASFLFSAATVGAFVPAFEVPSAIGERRSYRRQLAAGFRFLHADKLLLWMAVALMIFNPFSNPLGPVFLPVYAERFYRNATYLGLMVAAIGVGGVAGSFLYGLIGDRLPRRSLWLLPFLLGPIEYWGLLPHPPLPVVIALLVIVGLVFGPFNPVMSTVRQERVPLEMRGRVFSLFSAMTLAAQPIGIMLAGLAIDAIGFNPTLFLFATVLQVLGITLLFVPELHDMDRRLAP